MITECELARFGHVQLYMLATIHQLVLQNSFYVIFLLSVRLSKRLTSFLGTVQVTREIRMITVQVKLPILLYSHAINDFVYSSVCGIY